MSYDDLPGRGWGQPRRILLDEIARRVSRLARCIVTAVDWTWRR